jgi:hypothetical protein
MYATTIEKDGEILWIGRFPDQPPLRGVTEALRADAQKSRDYAQLLERNPDGRPDFRCNNSELAADCREYAVKLLDLALDVMTDPTQFQIISRESER